MADKNTYIQHTVITDTTVNDFISSNDSIITGISKFDFHLIKDENGKSNRIYIYAAYTKAEQKDPVLQRKWLNNDLDIIKSGTTLTIPISQLNAELIVAGGKNLFLDQNGPLLAYFTEEQKELQADPRYSPLERLTLKGRDITVQDIEQNCQVWIYVKSIDKLLDISPFINSIVTNKNEIGQFSINLNPIEIEVDRESGSISSVFVSVKNKREYLNQYEMKKLDGVANLSFFDKYCQQNDAVFIRFEKLQLEEDNVIKKSGSNFIEVDKLSLESQIFDMIGLVDNVSSVINSESLDYSVNISGRDLMKVLIEDGAYLLDIVFAKGAENTFYFLGQDGDKAFKRNFVNNGAFEYLFKEYFDPIKTYMGFIINQLSNVGWTGDNDLFKYYKNKPEKYKIGINNEGTYLKNVEVNGIWQIIHLRVDPNLSDRRIIDGSFIDTDGTLYEQFKKACQSPFVEFWGDTYKSQFNFIARQQPFDRKGMSDVLANKEYIIDIESENVLQINLGWETEYYSWFQFFPSSEIWGHDKFFYAANFPIIYLDKYVEHFGNHKKVIQDNYVFGEAVDTVKGGENKANIAKGLFNDLKYIIESLSVLPFTRRGSITINGDRRIKKGSFIRLKATNEICYVDAVSNTLTVGAGIKRVTTLSLKRCMLEDNLESLNSNVELTGSSGLMSKDEIKFRASQRSSGVVLLDDVGVTPTRKITYYDIVNTDVIISTLKNRYEGIIFESEEGKTIPTKETTQINTDFGVNKLAFNYFLQKRQMDNF